MDLGPYSTLRACDCSYFRLRVPLNINSVTTSHQGRNNMNQVWCLCLILLMFSTPSVLGSWTAHCWKEAGWNDITAFFWRCHGQLKMSETDLQRAGSPACLMDEIQPQRCNGAQHVHRKQRERGGTPVLKWGARAHFGMGCNTGYELHI